MTVSKRLRYEILRRDNHACRYCGRVAPAVALTVDHVLPVALGGSDSPENLTTACVECNAGKSASAPDAATLEQVSEDSIRWARAIAQAAALAAADVQRREDLNREIHELWVENCTNTMGRVWPRPADWAESLDTFRARGLTQSVIVDAFWIAANSSAPTAAVWRYMCGVCWRRLEQIEASARDLLAVEEAGHGP